MKVITAAQEHGILPRIYAPGDVGYEAFAAARTAAPWGQHPDYPDDLDGLYVEDGKHHIFNGGRPTGIWTRRSDAIWYWWQHRRG